MTHVPQQDQDPRTATVIVVGAGPAGAALALLLARCGIDTVLLERHADLEREFRGEGVQPSGLRCLEQMGLAAEVAALPQTRLRRTVFGFGGRADRPARTVEVPALEGEGSGLRLIAQPALLRMLCAKAAEHPGFSLRMGVGVRGLLRDEQGRVIGVRLDGGETLRADFVIATDGRHSMVRKRLAIAIEQVEQSFDVVWARAALDGPLVAPEQAYVEMLPQGGFASVFPAPAGGHQIGVIIRKGVFPELRASGQIEELRWLRGHIGKSLWETLERAREQLRDPVLLDVICGQVPRWSAPGALLLGDAAHPMSPVGGQGINMALRDAVVAANHLVPALHEAAGLTPVERAGRLDAAARAIEAERRPEIDAIQALQTARARGIRPRGWLALRLMAAVVQVRPLLRLLLRPRAPFWRGQTEVELRV